MTQPSPLVSVITAIYNQEHLLQQTIESVINQTFTNWEYLLVDDGSADQSAQIAKEYAKNYQGKVIYCEHEGHVNRGVSATRNLGLSAARGEYIALLDGDDLWLPEKLQKQVAILKATPRIAMVCESSYYWEMGTDITAEKREIAVGVPGNQLYDPPELALRLHPLGKGDAPCTGSIMMKTAVFRDLGGFEESFVGKDSLYEDQAFLIKFYLNEPVFVSADCNNVYRLHTKSAMHSLMAQGHESRGHRFFLNWFTEYVRDQGIRYPDVTRVLVKSLWPYKHPRLYSIKSLLSRVLRISSARLST